MSDWIDRPRRRLRDLGRRRRHVPARLRPRRRRRDHPRRRPGRPARPRLRGRGARRAARSPTSACARSCRCSCSRCSTRSTTTTRARSASSSSAASSSSDGLRAPASALGDVSRGCCSSGISPASSSVRTVSVSAERARSGVEGLREPQRLSQQLSTLLAAEIVSGRIGVGRGVPVLRGDREPLRRQPHGRPRDGAGARDARAWCNVQHGKRTEVLPARGLGHPQRRRAGGAAARGQGRAAAARPLRVPPPDRAAGGRAGWPSTAGDEDLEELGELVDTDGAARRRRRRRSPT